MKMFIVGGLALAALILVLSGCGGPSESEKRYNAGLDFQEQGRLVEAIAEYDEAIRLDPQHVDAFNDRGVAYNDLGRFQRAIQDYDEAIRLNPEIALAHANRAIAYTHLGKDAEADQDVDRAVELGFDRSVLDSDFERLRSER